MDEARAVLARLERIDALERADAQPGELLGELRELVREAEAWARRERDDGALAAVDRCSSSLGGLASQWTRSPAALRPSAPSR